MQVDTAKLRARYEGVEFHNGDPVTILAEELLFLLAIAEASEGLRADGVACPICEGTGRVDSVREACGPPRHLDEPQRCNRPPAGWYCGLERAHDGPCPAWPVSHETAAEASEGLRAENARLLGLLNSPELHDFTRGAVLEAGHQRERWGTEHDSGKGPQDWFWLVGYLAGKALASHLAGNTDKALHHTITAAAAMANWHGAILGTTNMRPGIDGNAALSGAVTAGEGHDG